jgi:hypothetical protein
LTRRIDCRHARVCVLLYSSLGRRSIAVDARSFDLSSGPPRKEMPGVEPAPRSALGTQREVMW